MQRYTKKTIRKFLFHFSSFFIPPNLNYPSLLPFSYNIFLLVLHFSTFLPVLAALFSSLFPRPKSIAPLFFSPTSIVFLPDFHSFALQSLFPSIPTSVFPLSNLQCTTLFPIPTFRVTFPFPTCPDSPLVVTFFPSFWPSNSSSLQLHHSFAHRSL